MRSKSGSEGRHAPAKKGRALPMVRPKLQADYDNPAIGGTGLLTARKLAAGEKVFDLRTTKFRTRTSIELDKGLFSEGADEFNDFLNHNCTPNLYVDFEGQCLRTRWEIEKGQEVFMNYLTTEWELVAPFECGCGSVHCFGTIAGFRHLGPCQRIRLEELMAPHPIADHLKTRVEGM